MEDTRTPAWLASEIPGAADLIAWFGYWPSFHDGEVISIELARSGTSRICVHAFERSGATVVVTFLLGGVHDLDLHGFSHQNVVAGLQLRKAEQGYELELEGCFGVQGVIAAESVSIELTPGGNCGGRIQST